MVKKFYLTNPTTGSQERFSTRSQQRRRLESLKSLPGVTYSIKKALDKEYYMQGSSYKRRVRAKESAANERLIQSLIQAGVVKKKVQGGQLTTVKQIQQGIIKLKSPGGFVVTGTGEVATAKAAKALDVIAKQKRTQQEQQLANKLNAIKRQGGSFRAQGTTIQINQPITTQPLTPIEKKAVGGVISEFKKPSTVRDPIKRLSYELTRQEEIQKELLKTASPLEKQLRGTLALGAIGAIKGGVELAKDILNPKQTVKNLIEAAKRPDKTVTAMAHEFIVNPTGTIASFWSYSKALGAASKAVKRSPVGRLALEELYIRAQPKELRPSVRAIIKSVEAQRSLYPTPIRQIAKPKKITFVKVKSLNKIEAKAVKKALEQNNSVLFGSEASRIAAGKKYKSQLPQAKDVDIATSSITDFNKSFIDALPKSIKKNYLTKGQKVIRKSNKEALFDIKPISRLIPERSLLTKRGYLPVSGYVRVFKAPKGSVLPRLSKKRVTGALEIPTGKLIKVGKFKITGFAEQTLRKGLGTLQVLIEKNIRRAKDPQAFVKSLQIQIEALKLTKPKTALGRLRKTRKLKVLNDAVKILTSKQFAKLLEKKVPGILKEYPILKKINVSKLKKVKKTKLKDIKKAVIKKKTKLKAKRKTTKKPQRKTTKKKSKLKAKRKTTKEPQRKTTKKKSKLPKKRPSKLPKGRPSRLVKSKLAKKLSKLPKKILLKSISKLPNIDKSRLRSKLPIKQPSKIPINKVTTTLSKLPINKISNLVSTLPTKSISNLISKLPSNIKRRLLPPKIVKPKKLVKPKLKKKKVIRKKTGQGYSVLIREKGKTVRGNVPKRLLPRLEALRVRDSLLDKTVAASGRIVPGKKKVPLSRKSLLVGRPKRATRKLRAGKTAKTRNKVVEKRKYRIDSRGEKQGLTAAKFVKQRLAKLKKQKKKVKKAAKKKSKKK